MTAGDPLSNLHAMTQPCRRACACPGCGMPITLEVREIDAPDDPRSRDVMCALCGTVTARSWLTRRARASA
jgi:hypothetical protein